MTYLGHIKSYDNSNGIGLISPDDGGDDLPFKRADLQEQERAPVTDQRFCYETSEVNGANRRAINLREPDGARIKMEQARSQRG
ncbi:cold-shock protein [Alteraurantiacibacter aquimixticola]|uniref:Cold-shock protein n=1 Tax=Alteraurantiacibacter aquimixticola TaxID=2489173 RepID=A0A4T3F2K4_9SPHN|nr:cold-shock protein [Alteraurantiacibacter aquimixticola]TIX49645.1 cold-shock protein [Alteraurantiacibacter aquimixticola]